MVEESRLPSSDRHRFTDAFFIYFLYYLMQCRTEIAERVLTPIIFTNIFTN